MASESIKKLHQILLDNPDLHVRLITALGELKVAAGEGFAAEDVFPAILLAQKAFEKSNAIRGGGYSIEFKCHYEEQEGRR